MLLAAVAAAVPVTPTSPTFSNPWPVIMPALLGCFGVLLALALTIRLVRSAANPSAGSDSAL